MCDSTPWFEENNDIENRPNGEIYVEASAAEIQGYIDSLLARYFPKGRPAVEDPTARPRPIYLPILDAPRSEALRAYITDNRSETHDRRATSGQSPDHEFALR